MREGESDKQAVKVVSPVTASFNSDSSPEALPGRISYEHINQLMGESIHATRVQDPIMSHGPSLLRAGLGRYEAFRARVFGRTLQI